MSARWVTLWGVTTILGLTVCGFSLCCHEWLPAAICGLVGVYSLLRVIDNVRESEGRR